MRHGTGEPTQRSGSSRWVKPSITRFATCPGSGAFSQPSIGANSYASGLSSPPARRYLRYRTVSMLTVPMAPARRPPTMAVSGVIGCLRTRIPSPIAVVVTSLIWVTAVDATGLVLPAQWCTGRPDAPGKDPGRCPGPWCRRRFASPSWISAPAASPDRGASNLLVHQGEPGQRPGRTRVRRGRPERDRRGQDRWHRHRPPASTGIMTLLFATGAGPATPAPASRRRRRAAHMIGGSPWNISSP
jgi:hypothetical protein